MSGLALMFCINCGASNAREYHYCHNCGASLPSLPPPATNPEPESINSLDHETQGGSAGYVYARIRPANFLIKHWRGDLSLAFSYWVVGGLLTAVVAMISAALGATRASYDLGPTASGFLILAIYAFVVPVTVWQLVGIWRSADKHTGNGGSDIWAGLAKVMVIAGLFRAIGDFASTGVPLVSEGAKLIMGIDDTPPYQIRLLRDGTELELAGGMPFGTTDAIRSVLDAAPAVHVIHLNSQGGRISEAYKLYKAIKEQNLITFTSADCASACTIAFLAGRERYLGESGRLGFHSLSIGRRGGEVAEQLNGDVRRTLKDHGVPDRFIERALSTSPADMWYPSKQELLDAKVIDSVVDSRDFGLSGVLQWRDAHQIEAQLLDVPLYAVIAQYDQQNYTKLRALLVSGVQNGRSLTEIENDVHSHFVGKMIPTYLDKAPDDVLIRYWRSQMAEMRYLAEQDPQKCADFAYPEFAKSRLDLQSLLPRGLLTEDMDSLAALVKGVATNPQGHEISPQIRKDLDQAVLQIAKVYPWAIQAISEPAKYKGNPRILCGVALALYSEILALPTSNRSGPVLRYMLSN